MKLQIDTVAKTIKLEQVAKITEILSAIKKLLPNEWKEYSLEAVTIINNWSNPIYIERWPYSYPYWWLQPSSVCVNIDSGSGSLTVTNNDDFTVSAHFTTNQASASNFEIVSLNN